MSASGRAAMRLPSDANDVALLTKRFASDPLLIQDQHINSESPLCSVSFSFID